MRPSANPAIPPLGADHIYRPRLVEKLNSGLTRKLTILTAPAGYGKTALVSEWAAQLELPVMWLSLQSSDANFDRSYARFNASMNRLFPEFHTELPISITPLIEAEHYESVFMESIQALDRDFVAVLDNYQIMPMQMSKRIMEVLLEVLPSFMHWVILTRVTVPFSIARLRAKGDILELDARDLRFTRDEVETFFISRKGHSISFSGLNQLYQKTDGWIGLMQLAALSIERKAPVEQDQVIEQITSQDAYIQDYFSEEVFSTQDEIVQDYMLRTSTLGKFTASLAHHMVDRPNADRITQQLIDNGLLVPASGDPHRVKYHSLFVNYLRDRALKLYGMDTITGLHRRASAWYEEKGLLADAVNHAFGAMDVNLATRLLNMNTEETDLREYLVWQKWFVKLPEDVQREHPDMCSLGANAFYLTKDFENMERLLRVAEQVWTAQEDRENLAEVYMTRSMAALYSRRFDETIRYARRALNAADPYILGSSHHVLGAGLFYTGKIAEAEQHVFAGREQLLEVEDLYSAQIATALLARVRAAQGRLREAAVIYQEVCAYSDPKVYEQVIAAHIFLSQLYYEWNELELAQKHLTIALEQSPLRYSGRHWPEAHVILAQVLAAMGFEQDARLELRKAAGVAGQLEARFQRQHAESMEARLDIRKGNLLRAVEWEDNRAPEVNLRLATDYALNTEYLTMIRLTIARLRIASNIGLTEQAGALLEHILADASENERIPEVIECHILKALLHDALDAPERAFEALETALTLAQPEGYVRSFLDEGNSMRSLLTQAMARGVAPDYASRLLAEYDRYPGSDARSGTRVIILSDREIEVLRHIAEGLTAKEIAEKLVLSWHTVRTHTKNIYSKLGVHNSFEAVKKAELLNIL